MAPNVGIFLIWTGVCLFLQVDHVNGAHSLPGTPQYSSFKPENSCHFPFTYGDQKYFDCTKIDSLSSWCSLTEEYTGRWKYCTKDDYARCFFPFMYKGKVYDSCTSDGSAFNMFWCALSPDYDKDGFWKHCYD